MALRTGEGVPGKSGTGRGTGGGTGIINCRLPPGTGLTVD
jgi:hypothetical protein